MNARVELFMTHDDPSLVYLSHAFNRLKFFEDRDGEADREGFPGELSKAKLRITHNGRAAFYPDDIAKVCRLLCHRARLAREHATQYETANPRRIELEAAADNAECCALQLADWWDQNSAPVRDALVALLPITEVEEPETADHHG